MADDERGKTMSTYFNVLGKVGKVKAVGEKMTVIDIASNHVSKGTTYTTWANIMFYTEGVSKVLPYITVGDTLFISGKLTTIKDKNSGFDKLQLMGDKIDLCGFSKGKKEPEIVEPNLGALEDKSEETPW